MITHLATIDAMGDNSEEMNWNDVVPICPLQKWNSPFEGWWRFLFFAQALCCPILLLHNLSIRRASSLWMALYAMLKKSRRALFFLKGASYAKNLRQWRSYNPDHVNDFLSIN